MNIRHFVVTLSTAGQQANDSYRLERGGNECFVIYPCLSFYRSFCAIYGWLCYSSRAIPTTSILWDDRNKLCV